MEKPNYTYEFILDRVVDGDTVKGVINLGMNISVYKTIRFMGIDTDEIRNKDVKLKLKAYEAKDRVIDLCEQASKIYIQTVRDKTGKYGRLLGYILCEQKDGTIININETLLAEGFAKAPKK